MTREARFCHALLDPEQPVPEELVSWTGADAGQRFNVYRNNVVVSLIEALASTFDVTQQQVGRRFFRALAREYVPEHLPDSPVLALYGATFPDFIARFPPLAQLPWLADLARLEWLRVRAYHAADAVPLSSAQILARGAAPQRLLNARVQLHPSLGLLDSPYAVASLWAAHQDQGRLADVTINQPQEILILRPRLDVEVTLLPPGGAQLLRLLLADHPLGSAITQTQAQHAHFDAQRTLEILLAAGALTELHPAQALTP